MKKIEFGASARKPLPSPPRETEARGANPSIGSIIRQICNLTNDQMREILRYQQARKVRFGEAAVALKFASKDDVMWAVSQQFHYPYAFADPTVFAPELVVATDPFGAQAEAFRELRSQLLLGVLAGDQPRKALAVVGVDSGVGKTYFAANIAIALSQVGGRTLLVDGDLRSPRLHTLFNFDSSVGLSSLLAGRCGIDVGPTGSFQPLMHPDRRLPTPPPTLRTEQRSNAPGAAPAGAGGIELIRRVKDLPDLFVLPVGTMPPNPLELLQRAEFTSLMRRLVSAFDHVIVDTPAANKGADARMIAVKCGAAVILARRHVSAVKPLQNLIEALARTPTKLAGVLLNER